MPWTVQKTGRCPASKPWGVIKQTDNSVAGCHPTKAEAQAQQAALYATEGASQKMTTAPTETGRPPRDQLVRASRALELVRADGEGDGEGVSGGLGMPTLHGHFAVFNEWTEINSAFEGHFLERIAPGAFAKTMSEQRDEIRVLFQHGHDPQIGDKPLGPIRSMSEDEHGASYEVPMLDTSYNRDLLPGLEAGLYGSSFRFRVTREEFDQEPKRTEANPEGLPERTIKEVRLFEFGPVTFPAYAAATAGVRSLTDEIIFEGMLREPERARELLEFVLGREAEQDDGSDEEPEDEAGDEAGEQDGADEGSEDSAPGEDAEHASPPPPRRAIKTPLLLHSQKEKPRWRL